VKTQELPYGMQFSEQGVKNCMPQWNEKILTKKVQDQPLKKSTPNHPK
jgi:hypothetical protein